MQPTPIQPKKSTPIQPSTTQTKIQSEKGTPQAQKTGISGLRQKFQSINEREVQNTLPSLTHLFSWPKLFSKNTLNTSEFNHIIDQSNFEENPSLSSSLKLTVQRFLTHKSYKHLAADFSAQVQNYLTKLNTELTQSKTNLQNLPINGANFIKRRNLQANIKTLENRIQNATFLNNILQSLYPSNKNIVSQTPSAASEAPPFQDPIQETKKAVEIFFKKAPIEEKLEFATIVINQPVNEAFIHSQEPEIISLAQAQGVLTQLTDASILLENTLLLTEELAIINTDSYQNTDSNQPLLENLTQAAAQELSSNGLIGNELLNAENTLKTCAPEAFNAINHHIETVVDNILKAETSSQSHDSSSATILEDNIQTINKTLNDTAAEFIESAQSIIKNMPINTPPPPPPPMVEMRQEPKVGNSLFDAIRNFNNEHLKATATPQPTHTKNTKDITENIFDRLKLALFLKRQSIQDDEEDEEDKGTSTNTSSSIPKTAEALSSTTQNSQSSANTKNIPPPPPPPPAPKEKAPTLFSKTTKPSTDPSSRQSMPTRDALLSAIRTGIQLHGIELQDTPNNDLKVGDNSTFNTSMLDQVKPTRDQGEESEFSDDDWE